MTKDVLNPMNSGNKLRAVMFADVSGSSALYKDVGNVEAKATIDHAIALMSEQTTAHRGCVVKTIGDEIMARFDCAEDACHTAMAIQHHCSRSQELANLTIRIGMDFGPTLLDRDDIFGDTVNDAAFIAHIARGNQILLSDTMRQTLRADIISLCQEFDRLQIKGHRNKTAIYRLEWEAPTQSHGATTVMSIKDITQQLNENALILVCNGESTSIPPDQTPFVIGRDQHNTHLHISAGLASRDHCHIDYRRGKFVLVDHSTNGTFVKLPNQAEIYLRREELPLMGQGSISIGQSAQQPGSQVLTFNCKS